MAAGPGSESGRPGRSPARIRHSYTCGGRQKSRNPKGGEVSGSRSLTWWRREAIPVLTWKRQLSGCPVMTLPGVCQSSPTCARPRAAVPRILSVLSNVITDLTLSWNGRPRQRVPGLRVVWCGVVHGQGNFGFIPDSLAIKVGEF